MAYCGAEGCRALLGWTLRLRSGQALREKRAKDGAPPTWLVKAKIKVKSQNQNQRQRQRAGAPALHVQTRKCLGFLRTRAFCCCLEIVVAPSALPFGAEQGASLTKYDWQFQFQHVPDDTMVDFGIAVDEDVPEGDDALIFADLRGRRWVDSGSLGKRLSDDFQLPLDRRAQHRVGAVAGEALACDEPKGQFGRTCNVVEIFLRFNPHRRVSGWTRRPGGNTGSEWRRQRLNPLGAETTLADLPAGRSRHPRID